MNEESRTKYYKMIAKKVNESFNECSRDGLSVQEFLEIFRLFLIESTFEILQKTTDDKVIEDFIDLNTRFMEAFNFKKRIRAETEGYKNALKEQKEKNKV